LTVINDCTLLSVRKIRFKPFERYISYITP